MCGVLGYVKKNPNRHLKGHQEFLRQGLIIDILRGTQGTGVFNSLPQGGYSWAKSEFDGFNFQRTQQYKDNDGSRRRAWATAAHNRAATIGDTTMANAHPFVSDDEDKNVVLIHNGTLAHASGLPVSQADCKVDVDSHAIAINLGLVSPEKACDDVVSKINGAFTLIWHDLRDESFNIVRNGQRPLHMGWSDSLDTLFFISEAEQLRFLNDRIGLGIKEMYQPEPGVWMKFKEGSIKPVVRKVPLQPKPAKRVANYTANTNNRGSSMGNSSKAVLTSPTVKAQEASKLMEAELNAAGLSGKDILRFTPIEVIDYKDKSHLKGVRGFVDSLNMEMTVHGVSKYSCEHNMTKRWAVSPIGVSFVADPTLKRDVATLLGQIKNIQGDNISEVFHAKKPKGAAKPQVWAGDKWVSRNEWLELTEQGCGMCMDELYPDQQYEILWDSYMGPVCSTCTRLVTGFDEEIRAAEQR